MRRLMSLILCGAMALLIGAAPQANNALSPDILQMNERDKGDLDQGPVVDVVIVMYHSLHNSAANQWTLPPGKFEQDLKYLSDNGYQTVFMQDVIDFVYEGSPLPPKPVVLSFDDGYYNNYSQALPLLEKYDMKMSLSVIGDLADLWTEEGSTDEKDGHATWDQLNEMVQSGRVELVNHSYGMHTHKNGRNGCAKKSGESCDQYAASLRQDVGKLQQLILEKCGVQPQTFAYPFGSLCPEANEILREMGLRATLACSDGVNRVQVGRQDCLFDLKRNNRTPSRSVAKIMEETMPARK